MRKRRFGWPEIIGSALRLGAGASTVAGLRMAKLAKGGAAARRESSRMVSEKVRAARDANLEAARAIIGGKSHRLPARVISLYQKRVSGNLRRLSK
ncbi:MAG: hypothetical protein L0Y57_13885 [Beijerinckiaceae bacterium]|nr:hypothetical protein [Beijerinckiaceae bacterium]